MSKLNAVMACLFVFGFSVSAFANESAIDPVGGPKFAEERVEAYSTNTYYVRIYGGESTYIDLIGDGDTDLDLYVYDHNGRLLASSDGWNDLESIWVYPYYTQTIRIEVVNRGSVYNWMLLEVY